MNEENKEEVTEAEKAEIEEQASENAEKMSRKPMFIALAGIGVLIFGAVLILIFRSRESGQVVSAPRSVSFDESGGQTANPNEERIVTLEPGQVERVGIKIETVGEQMSGEAASVSSTGVVQSNAYAETPVISLIGGVVRRVDGELGENVEKGQTVVVVFSDELASSQSRYLTLQTEAQTARQNYERAAKLVKISPVSNTELDETSAKLKIAEAELEEHHKHHERTVKLLKIGAASREEFEQATTRLKTAQAEVEEARKRYDRAAQVAKINPVSNAELEQAAVKSRTAEAELASAKQRLLLLGIPEQKINALRSVAQISAELALSAPVAGTITNRAVNPGAVVEANKELLKITDLDTIWVIAQIYEKDLGRIQTGSGASVTTAAYPNRVFRGRVSYIDPNINQETRTAQARVEIENPGHVFKIGQYVNVAFGSAGTAEKTMPVIPSAAVQYLNNQQMIFVATENPNAFILKPVRLGTESGGQYPVLEGLNVGDKIVAAGSFLLRAEWLKQRPDEQ